MSVEGGAVPMEEDDMPSCDSPSAPSATMDWAKTEEGTETKAPPPLPEHPPSTEISNVAVQSEAVPLVNPGASSGEHSSSPPPKGSVTVGQSKRSLEIAPAKNSDHMSLSPLGPPATEANSITQSNVSLGRNPPAYSENRLLSPSQTGAIATAQSASVPTRNPPANSDEYSFGPSDDEDDSENENGPEERVTASLCAATSFDMGILQSSIEGSKAALDLVVDKDVVMVVGKTGVGKSCLIQGIAGKQIHASTHRASFSGQTAAKTVYDAQNALPDFEIGHQKASKTRSLSALLRGDTVYLDSPGLEDTRGSEMDVATAALLSQVAKRCKCLRFVVLIHSASLLEERGNTFRSILQFAHKFVPDFSESKLSFMFLFTHTDEIAGMSNSSDDAKKRLQEEIIQIAEATKDEDILVVLEFVRKSLKKNYPFANILHPLDTNYPKLVEAIEKLQGVSDLTSASRCNLTLSSRMKLEVAVQHLLGDLQVALRSSSSISDIQQTLHYLREYVDVDFVRKVIRQSEEIVDDHEKELKRRIDSEFSRWSTSTGNARALRDALQEMESFDGKFSADVWIESKNNDVIVKLQEQVLAKASGCLEFRPELHLLQSWADAFKECSHFYTDTCMKIMALFEVTMDTVSKKDVATLHECSQEEVNSFAEKLLLLQTLSEQITDKSDLDGIQAHDSFACAIKRHSRISNDLECVFSSWACRAAKFAESKTRNVKDDLLEIASYASVLTSMNAVLGKGDAGVNSLVKAVKSVARSLENDVIGLFAFCCDNLTKTMSLCGPSWEPTLHWMRNACQTFSKIRFGCWKDMQLAISTVIEKIKLHLLSASRELETLSQVTKEHGMRSGEQLGHDLVKFRESKWFDSFLPEGDAFVANCCVALEFTFQTRIDKKESELANALTSLPKDTCFSPEPIKVLELLLPELKEIDEFRAVVETSPRSPKLGLFESCANHLEDHIGYLSNRASSTIKNWTRIMRDNKFDRVHCLAQSLDSIYADAKALSDIQSLETIAHKAKNITCSVSKAVGELTRLAESELNHFGDFVLKSNILTSIEACSPLKHIAKQLPDYKDVQNQVWNIVASECKKIEEEIETSSDWDRIDQHLKRFKSAVVLDAFVNQEVTARLNTLQRLRNKKEEQVDDHLQEMIRSNNFTGMAEFLTPLAQSNDQIKKQKFESFQESICLHLDTKIMEINRCLDNQDFLAEEDTIRSVSQGMTILTTAKENLQRFLKGKLNLTFCIRQLKKKIDDELTCLSEKLFESVRSKDYARAAVCKHRATLYIQHLKNDIAVQTKKRFSSAKMQYTKELHQIQNHVDSFVQSSFKDNVDLCRSLASLKQAKESNDDSMKQLSSLYDETTGKLTKSIRGFLATVRSSNVTEAHCFDDIIPLLFCLHHQVNGSIKSYLPIELTLECDELLDRLQLQKKDHDRILESEGDLERTFDIWAQRLDKLESPIWYRSFLPWGSRKTDRASYKNLKQKITKKIAERLKLAQDSLRSCDFLLLQNSIAFLTLAEKKLRCHIDNIPCLRTLKEQCVNSFLRLCGQSKKMFEADEILRFEERFAEYRGFVLCVPCILGSEKGMREFSLVNQMLYETFRRQIESFFAMVDSEDFDFIGLRQQVLCLRKVGDFVADRVTLLNAEITGNKWLGKIQDLCSEHFSSGRDFGKLKYYRELGVLPSAKKADIKKAFKEKARRHHPDKVCRDSCGDAGHMFRKIREAHDMLLASDHLTSQNQSQPFDDVLRGIGGKLRTLSKRFMEEQRYDSAERLLFQIPFLKELDNLCRPKLKSGDTQLGISEIIKGHVKKIRVEIDTNWSERRYKDLNDSIADLKLMESHFKSYPEVFETSWNTGIIGLIQKEIESLGQRARACVSSQSAAKARMGEFRQFFIEMGSVLVELPSFKAFTKNVMYNVLESCLDSAWGYGFLFELGLSLQKGNDSSNDSDNRIAQMLVAEFTHFKEVMTMVWNQETSQKPAEDVVMQMAGEHRESADRTTKMKIDQKELLDSFESYERQYKSMLGEYIKQDADLNDLVHKVKGLAQTLKISCNKILEQKEKNNFPVILAGVFSLFTILKSGASFNRIETATDSSSLGEKLLMKPHSIQVLTLLFMFGCGKGPQSSLDSQLMQIRTGEGKSIILGAAAVMFALLGFRVRTVCYSEYLSTRDFCLFEEVFQRFGLLEDVKYSKITTFAEDSNMSKGNIRHLTELLLRGNLLPKDLASLAISSKNKQTDTRCRRGRPGSQSLAISTEAKDDHKKTQLRRGRSRSSKTGKKKRRKTNDCSIEVKNSSHDEEESTSAALNIAVEAPLDVNEDESIKEEVLLVDEVDVFFGSEFYGKTYNQVIEFKEPEVATILKRIWETHNKSSQRLRLNDIKAMSEYKRLSKKLDSFGFLLDNEISLMLNQVKKVNDIPYYLDSENDRIGYKVMDTISYDVTYGYATIFAYLKEANNLKDKTAALSRALVMPVSCGQFSYANISPTRILGVSGTLEAICDYEKDVLGAYGLNRYIYVPSVYGDSNFHFDKAGDGIFFESNKSNFYHKISAEIKAVTKSKRAVIVFFRDRSKLNEFVASPTYRELGRHKSLLKEEMSSVEKEYVINKAATAGQTTLSISVFGRGTDFFCKDDSVEKNGGVHIIQTFLSEEVSEEVQIQGRTARQGKRGSFQMILLDSDLESEFGVSSAEREKVPKKQWYDWLCSVRLRHHKQQCLLVEANLAEAKEKDKMTHEFFDSLLAHDESKSEEQFKHLYQLIKKPPVPSTVSIDLAVVIDVTGSMAPYAKSTVSTIKSLLIGRNALTLRLTNNFPETEFHLKLSCLGFRDIDDGKNQFIELKSKDGSHFTSNASHALNFVERICAMPSGGHDLAEDIIGAMHHSISFSHAEDWASDIKFMMLFSDAPTHGLLPETSGPVNNADNYSSRHPNGLTCRSVTTSMVSKEVDLFFCSFNPTATAITEDDLLEHFKANPDNGAGCSVKRIPMVPADSKASDSSSMVGGYGRHIIFVLDESGSMSHSWDGVVVAYNKYIAKRKQSQSDSDLVSCVQFDSSSRTTVHQKLLSTAPETLSYRGGGTAFHPAAVAASKIAIGTPKSHIPAIIFMSDGQAGDASHAAREFSVLNDHVYKTSKNHLDLHVIAFGSGTNQSQLQQIASASVTGKVYASSNTADLAGVFVDIASTQNVSTFLETEIAKRISEAVSDKLSLEYFGS